MANYTLRIIQNGKSKSGTFSDNQRAQLPADPNTEYRIYDENGNLITHPVVERQGDDLLVYANKAKDGAPELILTDYFNKRPVLDADYVADAGNSLMTSDKVAAIMPLMASEVLAKAVTVAASLVIGGVILALFDDNDSKSGIRATNQDTNQNTNQDTSISKPKITINDVPDMKQGQVTDKITISGKLSDIDADATAIVMVNINGNSHQANVIGNTWTLEVDGTKLAAQVGSHVVSASVVATDKAGNSASDAVADNYNVTTADLMEPTITIAPIATITSKDGTTPLKGLMALNNENVDEVSVTVMVNGTEYPATPSADRKSWTANVPNSELAKAEGDTPIVATVRITKDGVSKEATNAENTETPVSNTANVTSFTVDTTVSSPKITINNVPNIEKGKENENYTISGTLEDIDADAIATVTVTVNNTVISPLQIDISTDKKTWTAKVEGKLLAEKVGDKQKVTASVSVVDANGHTAKSAPVEDLYNVTAPTQTTPTTTTQPPAALNKPYITVTPIKPINQANKDGKTTLTGKLDLNNENLDSATVMVSINGQDPVKADISDDKKSWILKDVDNKTLLGNETAPHTILATVVIAKDKQAETNTNKANDRDTDPTVNTDSFVADIDITKPVITIDDKLTSIEQGKENPTYTISGKLEKIDADATPVVTVNVNGVDKRANVSADKKTWSLDVDGKDLTKTVGDNKVTATVSVEDKVGNTAKADAPVEDTYKVTAASTAPTAPTTLNDPYITVTPIKPINQANKDGKTTLTGKLDLNNENLDSATVMVSINAQPPVEATISEDKKSWEIKDVPNSILIGDPDATHTIRAEVTIKKGDQEKANDNIMNDRDTDPAINTDGFVADIDITKPVIKIDDKLTSIEQGKENPTYTISGKLEKIDADATPVVTVNVNGVDKRANVSADKKTWSLDVDGKDLTKTVGDNKVTATVSVEDKVGNTAKADAPVEDTYKVTAASTAPTAPTTLNDPYITVTPIKPINQANKDGKTTLTGKLDLNNENLDSATVMVSINAQPPVEATISEDKKSWEIKDVPNSILIGDPDATHTIRAEVTIKKGDQEKANDNIMNDRDTDPAINTDGFVADIDITKPVIKIDDKLTSIEQGKENPTYTISGTLENIDPDATPVVMVNVNGVDKRANVSADKKTWSLDVDGKDLTKTIGDNKVTATVSVEDKVGNTAKADAPVEDTYKVTAASTAPTAPTTLNDPYITVTPIKPINQANKDGKTTLTGKLDLNNENLDSATVMVSINAQPPVEATISEDKKSWEIKDVPNSILIGDPDATHTIRAEVTIKKGSEAKSNDNILNDRDTDPDVNTGSFDADVAITKPVIKIDDKLTSIEQGKENTTYTISGTLENIDPDATPVVMVNVNGVDKRANVSADKKTWSLDVDGKDLTKTIGDNKVTATVSVEDKVGNTAKADAPVEDAYKVTAAAPVTPPAPVEPKITFDTLGHDVFSGRNETKTISGKATGLPNNAKIEVTVAGKPYEANLSGDTWSITIPENDLQQKGAKEVVAVIKVADNVVASSDKGSFFVITPSIAITSTPPSINNDNLKNKTVISGTYDADGADRTVISINIGQMIPTTFPGGLIIPTYNADSTVTTYKTTDANNLIKIDETNKTWSIEVENSVLAHQVGNPNTIGVQAYIEAYENYPNSSEPMYKNSGNAKGYTSEVEAPKSSPLIISDLVDKDTSNLATIISRTIDVANDDDHSVSGSDGIQDTFVFSKVLDGSIAQIANFNAAEDKLQLNSEVFTALSNTMSDFADYVQYNAATGALSYDADGTGAGAATQLAQLSKDLEIDQSNFIIA